MKNKKILIIVIALIVILIAFGIWYFLPTTFLKNVEASDVKEIEVFCGSTGEKFVIENEDEIKYIVENIQSTKMKKDKISVGYKGFSFLMKFKDTNGNIIESFYLNNESTIDKDPFFYKSEDGGLCSEYISNLHNMHVMLDGVDEESDSTQDLSDKTSDYGTDNVCDAIARYIKTKDGFLLHIMGMGPIEVNYNNAENKEEMESVIKDLTDGDLVEIQCGWVDESYPGKTDLYSIIKLKDGTINDISTDVIENLKDLGWIE